MKRSHTYKGVQILVLTAMVMPTPILVDGVNSSRAAVEQRVPRSNPVAANRADTDPLAYKERTSKAYGKLPLSFEANLGQTDPSVVFLYRGNCSNLFLTRTGAVLALSSQKDHPSGKSRFRAISMKMLGANPVAEVVGSNQLPGISNYLTGNVPEKWLSHIPRYARVQYRDLYPGVNLVYYGNEQLLEYDFEITPGANPSNIRIAFEGVHKLRVDTNGNLVLTKGRNEIRMHKPAVYQEVDGTKRSVACNYLVVRRKRQIGFRVGNYDKSKSLIIDPVLTYSTFLGGTNYDYGRSIALDSAGNAYVTGQTSSFNFPISINAYNSTYAYAYDVFVTKLNAEGTAIVYSTYLGGNADDIAYGIAVDSSGNAYITGSTSSTNYPTTTGAYQTTRSGNYGDAFVTKLNTDGTALVYSTYLGGSYSEQANGIAIDSSGNSYVTGYTSSSNFPTTAGAFRTTIHTVGSTDVFLTKLNDAGTGLVYSSLLGGSGTDQGNAIRVDSDGNAYVTGMTTSADFDVTPGAYQTTYGGASSSYYAYGDAFVTKFNSTGTTLVYSTYIGGSGDDAGFGIDLMPSEKVCLTGATTSVNFPTTEGVVRVGDGGLAKSTDGADAWNAINSGLTKPTQLSLAIDPLNPNVVFTGSSGGGVFKSTNAGGHWATANSGLTDLVINSLTIDPTATSIIYLGTSSRGVFRSTDSGDTWRAINSGQNGATVNVIRIDPVDSSIIYAGTSSGVSKSTDGGASWVSVNSGLSGYNVASMAIDPSATSTIYAGLSYYYGNGVYKTTDGGSHWIATSLSNASIKSLVLDPSSPTTIYAGTDNGCQKSTDGGVNWSGINNGLSNRGVNALAISPIDSLTIYAGTGNGVFKSSDGGTLWGPANSGLAGAVVHTLAIDPTAALTLYCGTVDGSTDGFVMKLNASGTGVEYSTYLGGSGDDQCFSVATDASGDAYVTGITASQNFPVAPGGYGLFGGYGTDAFVTKLNPTATTLVYSTYLGGNDYDQGLGLTVDSAGSAYVTGITQSQNFPTTVGAFQSTRTGYNADAFITKVAAVPNLTSDLAITMTASAGPFLAGSNVTYNIALTNNGPEPAFSILASDNLPSTLGYNSCSSSSSSTYCTNSGNSVTFAINSLDVGATVTLQIYAYVSCSIASSETIANSIVVNSPATDPNSSNNTSMTSITATHPPTTISPTNLSFPYFGGSGTVNVNTGGPACSWISMSNASWITITYSSNCCNGIVNYNVAPNLGLARTGTMTIAGQTFTVNQALGCTFSINHTSQTFTSGGGSDSIAVTASDAGCNWIAVSNDSFIIIAPGTGGNGNGNVNYSVASNPFLIPRSGTMTVAGNTFTVIQAGASSVPQFQGFHDGAGCNTIEGWAWDPNNPNATVIVDILDGTTLIGSAPANMYREDLLNALGSPNHGFSFLTPPALKNGAPHFITVRFSGTNTLLANTGRPVQCSEAPSFFGRHDGQGCNAIEGWAWDANDPNGTVNADIYDGTTLIGTVAATLYRQDLADAVSSPYHGFIFKTPASLKDGQPHTITIKFGGTNTNLPLNTPRTTSCISSAPDYQGSHDIADCNTISGFAWDTNDDQGTINVAIYIDGNFRVVVPAQQAYPGVGSGFHGFKFAVPASLKNGQQHSIQVRFSGTAITLSNSPKTITCSP